MSDTGSIISTSIVSESVVANSRMGSSQIDKKKKNRSSSTSSGIGSLFRKKKGENNWVGDIDKSRAETHRIYDIEEILGIQTFTRNCKSFKFTEKKGKKIYKPKACELKIEEYLSVKG